MLQRMKTHHYEGKIMNRKVSREMENKIYSLRINEGLTFKIIAERFSLHSNSVMAIIKRVEERNYKASVAELGI